MSELIYLDNHATTPLDPRVLERMMPYFTEHFGNAASRNHVFGWKAEEAVDAARGQVADLVGTSAREIIFTSGATESNNLAIFGVGEAYAKKGRHIVTQVTEHKAVLDPCAALAARGFEVTYLAVDSTGKVDPGAVADALRPETVLVSVMHVNNEIGTIQDIAAIGALCTDAGVLFHCDAAQGAGKLPIDVEAMRIDLLSLSAHKLYGPKGAGALYVRRKKPRVALVPLVYGGGHERGMRSGTLNVPAVVGLGAAASLAIDEMESDSQRICKLRDRLHAGLTAAIDGVTLNGPEAGRHPGNLNVCFAGVEAEALIMSLRMVAVSSGAACASATLEPSHVMRAIGVDAETTESSIRFGIGRFNTVEEIDCVIDLVVEKVNKLRELNPPGRSGRESSRRPGGRLH